MTILPALPNAYRDPRKGPVVELPVARLDQLRVGGIALIGDSGIRSGISKQAVDGPVWLGHSGFVHDEQRESFHGGNDRAVLQYSTDHYAPWAQEFPESVDRLVAGGFGENFVVSGMDESNMCIGDVITVGRAVIQVAESRQPCFKLNHRFNQPSMARRVQESGRTGWLYRVLEPGYVRAGDELRVVERPLPQWSIRRLQRYLYHEVDDLEMARHLADLPYLSKAQSALLWNRVDNAGQVEDWDGRLSNGDIGSTGLRWTTARIADIAQQTPDIKRFSIVRSDGQTWPQLPAGGHIKIKVDNTLTRSYSILSTRDRSTVHIAIAKSPQSSGGSVFMHETAAVGDELTVTEPQDSFPLGTPGKTHVLLASGIGITPFMSMIEKLEDAGEEWELHYCARTAQSAAFEEELRGEHPNRVNMHFTDGDPSRRLNVAALLAESAGRDVYCCGSPSFLASVRAATGHWPSEDVHFESFESLGKGRPREPFTAQINSTGQSVSVPAEASLLQALRAADVSVASSCETGTCGTCKVRFLSGAVDHRDMVLNRTERQDSIITCVSRATGTVVLDI